jgi:hypothetical protein
MQDLGDMGIDFKGEQYKRLTQTGTVGHLPHCVHW